MRLLSTFSGDGSCILYWEYAYWISLLVIYSIFYCWEIWGEIPFPIWLDKLFKFYWELNDFIKKALFSVFAIRLEEISSGLMLKFLTIFWSKIVIFFVFFSFFYCSSSKIIYELIILLKFKIFTEFLFLINFRLYDSLFYNFFDWYFSLRRF